MRVGLSSSGAGDSDSIAFKREPTLKQYEHRSLHRSARGELVPPLVALTNPWEGMKSMPNRPNHLDFWNDWHALHSSPESCTQYVKEQRTLIEIRTLEYNVLVSLYVKRLNDRFNMDFIRSANGKPCGIFASVY